jgi:hypothetical protein
MAWNEAARKLVKEAKERGEKLKYGDAIKLLSKGATGVAAAILPSSNPVRMIEAAQTFVLAAGGNVDNARKALDTYEQFNKLLNPPVSPNGAASDAPKAAPATSAASK